jgi:hypothetical protein
MAVRILCLVLGLNVITDESLGVSKQVFVGRRNAAINSARHFVYIFTDKTTNMSAVGNINITPKNFQVKSSLF